jgi:hypothetical protein
MRCLPQPSSCFRHSVPGRHDAKREEPRAYHRTVELVSIPSQTTANNWLVLFDDECGLCMWMLAGVLRWDRGRRLEALRPQDQRAELLLADMSEAQRLSSWHLIVPRAGVTPPATPSRRCSNCSRSARASLAPQGDTGTHTESLPLDCRSSTGALEVGATVVQGASHGHGQWHDPQLLRRAGLAFALSEC